MRFDAACQNKFGRHEKFAPRYLWSKKAYDASNFAPDLFSTDEGIDGLILELAVGKNMVKSIRYWGQAFRIFTEEKQKGKRPNLISPTPIGHAFFADTGWDPYCERPDTLWLLHWWLLAPKSFAPSWWLAFNEYTGLKFTAAELEQFITDRTTDWQPARSNIKKDVECLIQMYASGHSKKATFDDRLNHPFRELDLIRPVDREPGVYRFLVGPKVTLAPEVVAFACLDFVARTQIGQKTINVSRLAVEAGSPGKVFNLTETALTDLLEIVAAQPESKFKLTTAAGVARIALTGDPACIAADLIRGHYQKFVDHCQEPPGDLAGPGADLGLRLIDA